MSEIISPLSGRIYEICIKVGDRVERDQVVIILEAMKMETKILADEDGEVIEIKVNPGDLVDFGDVLAVID